MLTRDAILQAQTLKTETVTVPVWGEVIVSEITSADRIAFSRDVVAAQKREGVGDRLNVLCMAMLACRCVVDEAGARVFRDEDAEILTLKNYETLSAVYAAAAKLNGIGTAEERAGNSEPGQAETSSSPSA